MTERDTLTARANAWLTSAPDATVETLIADRHVAYELVEDLSELVDELAAALAVSPQHEEKKVDTRQMTPVNPANDRISASTGEKAARVHELKCWPEYYEHLVSGRKTFELRRNDRGFREGDTLHLREYVPGQDDHYTGREMRRVVTYMLSIDPSSDFVVLALAAVPSAEQQALRGLVNASMTVIGHAVDFHERRQMFLCTVCRYRDPLGDEGSKLHADECPIYKLHAAADVGALLIEPATWANAGATPSGEGATESAHQSSSLLEAAVLAVVPLLKKDEEKVDTRIGQTLPAPTDTATAGKNEKA